MRWFICGLVLMTSLGSKSAICPAAQGAKPISGWGEPIDPDRNCKIALDGEAMTIVVPAGSHTLDAPSGKRNAPRVLRDIEGSFQLSVKLTAVFPGGEEPSKVDPGTQAGGLIVWQDETNFVVFARAGGGSPTGESLIFSYWRDGQLQGQSQVADAPEYSGQSAWLRLTRRGDKLKAEVGPDGQSWIEARTIPIRLSSRLRLGVLATNTTAQPFQARFEELVYKAIPLYPPRDK